MAVSGSLQFRFGLFLSLGLALLLSGAEGAARGGRPRPQPMVNGVADVTKFGAKPDGKTNNAMAFIRAWNAACHSKMPARVVVPPGKFLVGEIYFQGPCASNPITVEIQGTMLVTTDMSEFTGQECILFQDVDNLNVYGAGTIDGQGSSAWRFSSKDPNNPLPVSMKFQNIRLGSIRGLNYVNSKGFHVTITNCTRLTADNLKFTAPDRSPRTDGIHVSRSDGVTISNSIISTGDDCISIGEGSTNVNVFGITCGPGHGISIGSLGHPNREEASVRGVHVSRATLKGTENGVRIKTFHSSTRIEASGITFEDITMIDVKNPIMIDQHYRSKKKSGDSFVKLSDIHFKNIRGTSISNVPVTLNCSRAVPCEGIELTDIDIALSANSRKKIPVSATCSFAKAVFRGKQNPPPCR